MDDLIRALQIFRQYGNSDWPTHCEHDTLYVCIDPGLVSPEDIERLDFLGFVPDEEDGSFYSFRFGSA